MSTFIDSSVSPLDLPTASALGCQPHEFFRLEGPFTVSGSVKTCGTTQQSSETLHVFAMNPRSSTEVSYGYFYWHLLHLGAHIKPIIHLADSNSNVSNLPSLFHISISHEKVSKEPRRIRLLHIEEGLQQPLSSRKRRMQISSLCFGSAEGSILLDLQGWSSSIQYYRNLS